MSVFLKAETQKSMGEMIAKSNKTLAKNSKIHDVPISTLGRWRKKFKENASFNNVGRPAHLDGYSIGELNLFVHRNYIWPGKLPKESRREVLGAKIKEEYYKTQQRRAELHGTEFIFKDVPYKTFLRHVRTF